MSTILFVNIIAMNNKIASGTHVFDLIHIILKKTENSSDGKIIQNVYMQINKRIQPKQVKTAKEKFKIELLK